MNRNAVLSLVLVFSIPLLIYLFAFAITVPDETFYEKEFTKTGVNVAQGMQLTRAILDFHYKQTDSLDNTALTQFEKDHLKDVRDVIQRGLALLAVLSFIVLLTSTQLPKKFVGRLWFYGSVLTFVFPVFVLITPFEKFFFRFHTIFFAPGTWQLEPTSLLITTYTSQFFYDALLRIFWISALLAIIIIGLYFMSKKK